MKRVLWADDNTDMRAMLGKLFADAPFALTLAESGADALKYYCDAREAGELFDLLILDVAMPDLSGQLIARIIRLTDQTTKIVFCTAYADLSFIEKNASEMGIEIWSKPLDVPDVELKIAVALS